MRTLTWPDTPQSERMAEYLSVNSKIRARNMETENIPVGGIRRQESIELMLIVKKIRCRME